MDIFLMLLTTIMAPIWYIWPCRQISMTFKTSGKSVPIKNVKLAKMLIAEKNTWGIATSHENRKRMSLGGVIAYMVFLPQIAFMPYNWWIYFKTGSGQWCEAEQTYLWTAMSYYLIALIIKLKESRKFSKGEIW